VDVLGNYVDIVLTAADVGSLKPSPVPFISISQLTKIPINRILFIGDSLHNDIFGASNVGMHCAHIARDECDGASKYTLNSNKDDVKLEVPYISLKSLHPSEFNDKTIEYIQKYIN
jgi:FMN phosphatase YigB (HAD superfamily)